MSDPLLTLRRVDSDASLIDEYAAQHGGRVELASVLSTGLDQTAQVLSVPSYAASYGFTWQRDEAADATWYPQGITTSADASPTGRVGGRELALVSWYAKGKNAHPPYGVRISLVDVTHRATPRYTHIGLIGVKRGATGVEPERIGVHAGGILWYGSRLYVADTRSGLRVFDLDDLVAVPMSCGHTHLCVPQREAFEAATAAGEPQFRWSFVALDRRDDGDQLIVGEYGMGRQTTRLASFALDDSGVGELIEVLDHSITNMQGAVRIGDEWHLSVSRGTRRRGNLWTSSGGRLAPYRASLGTGPEDLTYWPQHDEIWNVTEHPGRRYVYAMRRDSFAKVPWRRRAGNARRVVRTLADIISLP